MSKVFTFAIILQFDECVNNWYSLQYVLKNMLFIEIFLKAAASRKQTSTMPTVKGGGGGGGAFANLKMVEHNLFGQMFYTNGMGWGLY